ncbi:ATP-binding cassette domain-containing protein [Paenibacillus piri]|uniref:ATP-binding cassette domain-containing protein n=1 Tax=Paenibacillus piri TaxID=2547395 RepID=A0A4R5K6V0_9BACL|nr:ATP-binding cassette domain-containing protein [Paenibacillus piri]TDF90093.1 ATP-binding cassette domain-containing protein [Paenibacillus piri]
MESVISVKNVWLRYGSRHDWILREINLAVYEGEWVTIVGGNGSGKSTLVRLFNGLLKPSLGDVTVYGKTTSDVRNLMTIRQHVGMVFQNADNQIVGVTVQEDTIFGLYNIGVAQEQAEHRCRDVLQRLGLYEIKDHPPHLLSGGEKQKLAIAGVLAMEPKVIVFDECTSMLDSKSAKEVHKIMSDLHNCGFTIIQVTNEIEEIFTADRLVVMRKGTIRFDGTPREAVDNPAVFKDSALPPLFSVRIHNLLYASRNLHLPTAIERELADPLWKFV